MSAGTVITGGTVSANVIVMWNDAEPVLPWASVAVHVTVVAPTGNFVPEAGVQAGVSGPSTISLAEAAKVSTFPDGSGAASVMSDGTVTAGAVVSTIVTLNVLFDVLPAASLAVQVTVVWPIGKVDPE